MTDNKYDSIIVGSGAGGLTTAVALAQAGQKVLVCEQHYAPGGWTQSFTIGGYRFSPGVHYIGGVNPGEHLDQIFRGLGVSQDLEFLELNPNNFDHIFIGDERFDIPKGKDNYIKRLIARFPDEAKGIRKLFRTIDNIGSLISSLSRGKIPLSKLGSVKWAWKSGGALIDKYVKNPILRAILKSQSGDHGVPPAKVSALVQTGIMRHYYTGGFYPRGGAYVLPRAFVRALKRFGGEIRLSTPVNRIIVENGQAVGVEIGNGEKLFAKNIISNTDPETVFIKLIGKEHLSKKLNKKLGKIRYSTSSLCLFLAVDLDLKKLGYDSGNYWYYNDADIDNVYALGQTDNAVNNDPPAMFMTITTLKDPSKMKKGVHTIEAFCFANYEPFKKWENELSGNRSEEYKTLKDEIADRMLNFLDKRIPGFKKSVVFKELATPLTNIHYINSHKGNIYGTDKITRQMIFLGFNTKTEIKNLYLCGASTLSHGVAGVIGTGLRAAAVILDCKTKDLLKQNGPELKITYSE
ncbi:MAG: FAD-dependent oxidoreductase [Planctomycetia bacterium]|nr:FAD-dependent oxidoreductase [Planctomycetia bacterium]